MVKTGIIGILASKGAHLKEFERLIVAVREGLYR